MVYEKYKKTHKNSKFSSLDEKGGLQDDVPGNSEKQKCDLFLLIV